MGARQAKNAPLSAVMIIFILHCSDDHGGGGGGDGNDHGDDNKDKDKDDCDHDSMMMVRMIQWQQRKSPALRDIEITRARVTRTTCVLQIVIDKMRKIAL